MGATHDQLRTDTGEVYDEAQRRYESLADVSAVELQGNQLPSSPSDGEVLRYNGTQWEHLADTDHGKLHKVVEGTVNAGHPDFTGANNAEKVDAAIQFANTNNHPLCLVPESLIPYDPTAMPNGHLDSVRMVREGQIADVYDVKAYGAAGDWDGSSGTDDAAAFQAAIDAAKTSGLDQEKPQPLSIPYSRYLIGSSLFTGHAGGSGDELNLIRSSGARLVGQTGGEPIIDNTGGKVFDIDGPLVLVGDSTSTPNVGVLLARNDSNASVGESRWYNLKTTGEFTVAAYYNYAAEDCWHFGCVFKNKAGRTSVVITDANVDGVTSPHTTIASGSQSNNLHHFYGCKFDWQGSAGITNSACIDLVGTRDTLLKGPFFNSGPDDHPCVLIRRDGANTQPDTIAVENPLFHGTPDAGVRYENIAKNVSVDRPRGAVASNVVEGGNNVTVQQGEFTNIRNQKIDFSDSGADLDDGCFISTTGDVEIGRRFQGEMYVLSTATVTVDDANTTGRILFVDTGEERRWGADIDRNINRETLSGSKTLLDTGPQRHHLDPGGSSRDVELPVKSEGAKKIIANRAGSGSSEDLNVNENSSDSGNLVQAVSPQEIGIFECDGTGWVAMVTSGTVK